jgi:ABC-2 type transport system ATP-binding protein
VTTVSRRLWERTLVYGAIAVGLVAVVEGPLGGGVAWPTSLLCGAAAATVLFGILAGQLRLPRRAGDTSLPRLAAKCTFLSLRSASEEVVWRWAVLGSLSASAGSATALLLSTLGFALSHAPAQGRRGVVVHLLTGATFGGIYVATGSLLAAIAAHVTYNLLVAIAVEGQHPSQSSEEQTAAATERPDVVAELRGVRKSFRRTTALDAVTLALRRHEVVALLGPNGAGKTTALSILLGLRRPDAGRALLFGADPRRAHARRAIGATPQESGFSPALTVAEHVELVRAHYDDPAPTLELLERFRLADVRDKQVGGLSGGQRRRLAVALAFAGNPQAVFLDEPSAGLDVESRLSVWSVIDGYARAGGTVLLTTHNLQEAEALAGRIVVMANGAIVADGPIAEIKARSGFSRLRLKPQPLPDLPGVLRVTQGEMSVELDVEHAQPVLEQLVEIGADLSGIEVRSVSLEEAFLDLIAPR